MEKDPVRMLSECLDNCIRMIEEEKMWESVFGLVRSQSDNTLGTKELIILGNIRKKRNLILVEHALPYYYLALIRMSYNPLQYAKYIEEINDGLMKVSSDLDILEGYNEA